jgi:hypothetical protein
MGAHNKGRWTPEEDAKLIGEVTEHGVNDLFGVTMLRMHRVVEGGPGIWIQTSAQYDASDDTGRRINVDWS